MADTYDHRTTNRSSPMIFAIVAVSVIAVTALMVYISERPGGEYVGIEAAPTETDLGAEASAMDEDMAMPVVENSGTAVTPEDTNEMVAPVPAEDAIADED